MSICIYMRQRLCSATVIPTTLAVSSESFSVLILQIEKPRANKKDALQKSVIDHCSIEFDNCGGIILKKNQSGRVA